LYEPVDRPLITMWPLRIALSKLRPFTAATITRSSIVAALFCAFLYGDFALFRRLFAAMAKVEQASPFLALGLLRNLLALVFLAAFVMLFSSAMTSAIGAFFSDLDLDTFHAAPRSKTRLVMARWGKTFAQSATMIYIFIAPLFVAFAQRYHTPARLYAIALINLALLLSISVTIGALVIVVLVRFFPVQRVSQIVATIAILVLTVAVVAFRMSRPERLFASINTDDVTRILRSIELPSLDRYPGTALAEAMVAAAEGRPAPIVLPRIAVTAAALFGIFVFVARGIYFAAFVRARESMAPAAIGATGLTRTADFLLRPFSAPTRAMIGKEVRTLTRDVAQWSQLFLMGALVFLYLYNIRMLPLGGDARATIVAYANLGMAGFVVAAICLRFAYPSISSEGKAFWMLQSAPVSYRRLLIVKVLVFGAPLTILSLLLTVFADVLLDANRVIWTFTLFGASMLGVTLVSMGVGLGALSPDFAAENPLQVGLSLGGFAYMAAALAYVGGVMMLMAKPVTRYFFSRFFGIEGQTLTVDLIPMVTAVTLSAALCVFPLMAAEKRLTALAESR
jgi:ABC-2 type transport system permease protein